MALVISVIHHVDSKLAWTMGTYGTSCCSSDCCWCSSTSLTSSLSQSTRRRY